MKHVGESELNPTISPMGSKILTEEMLHPCGKTRKQDFWTQVSTVCEADDKEKQRAENGKTVSNSRKQPFIYKRIMHMEEGY